MYSVTKRDGQVVEFDIQKICKAITKAFDAVEKQYHPSTIDLLALKVTRTLSPRSGTAGCRWRTFRTVWKTC